MKKVITLEDVLFKKDHTFVGITSIRHLQVPMTLRFITVDKNPNFWAAENGVLVHNGPYSGWVVYCSTKASLLAAAGLAVTGTGIVAGTSTISAIAGGATVGTAAILAGIEIASLAAAAPFTASLWLP